MTNLGTTSLTPPDMTALDALVASLADPAVPLEVDLWDDDGLALVHIVLHVDGEPVALDAEYQLVRDGSVYLSQPTLSEDTQAELATAGVLPSEEDSPETLETISRLEMAVGTAQHHRIAQAIRQTRATA